MRLKGRPKLRFAGQITGVEGYVESAAIGLLAGRMAAAEAKGFEWQDPPLETAHGALLSHITGGAMADSFQPMNVNFGLFPELPLNEKDAAFVGVIEKPHMQTRIEIHGRLGLIGRRSGDHGYFK